MWGNKYWNDGSYFNYSYSSQTHIDNLKVFYNNDDHTAITTSDPNIFISKMGCGCLVAHDKDNSPYVEGNFIYYKKTPTIIGTNAVCSSGTAFLVDIPSGITVTWTNSSNIQPVNEYTGNQKTFIPNGSGAGWIQASINGTLTYKKKYMGRCTSRY